MSSSITIQHPTPAPASRRRDPAVDGGHHRARSRPRRRRPRLRRRTNGGELLLVPKVGDRYARSACWRASSRPACCPAALDALVVRATGRARVGAGVVGTGAGLWVNGGAARRDPIPRRVPCDWAPSCGPPFASSSKRSETGRCAASCAASRPTTPAPWPTSPAGGPTCHRLARSSSSRRSTSRSGYVSSSGWAQEAIAERELAEKIAGDVRDGLDQQQREHLLRRQMEAIRKELGDDAPEGESVDDYRVPHR